MNLLSIDNVSIAFADGFHAVKNVSLAVKEGEIVALIGNSGSGKSTLANAILRLQENVSLSGKIIFEKQDLINLPETEMVKIRGAKIAMIFQEPMTSLNPLHSAGTQIMESLKIHHNNPSKEHVLELLKMVDLNPRVYTSYPYQLSGGQRQRVMIAMALAGNPQLLIADEPTTALDVSVQMQILKLLKTLQQKLGLAILFITHDLDVVKSIADRVYVMQKGRVISTKVPTQTLPQKNISRKIGKPVFRAQNINVYYDKFHAVQDVSFDVYTGQTLGIVGESGSGKSSLGQGLLRLIPATGKTLINDTDFFTLNGAKLRQARGLIQMVLQDPAGSLNPRMSVDEILSEGLLVQKYAPADITKRIQQTLNDVGLSLSVLNRYPHELSGGQRARIALARALVLRPQIIVLDEVTSALDIHTQRQLLDLLLFLQKTYGLSYIFISHDMKMVQALADDILVMKDGKVIEMGPAKQIFSKPKHPYTKSLLKASFLS